MNLFKKRLRVKFQPHPLVLKFSQRLTAFQETMANHLNRKTNHFSKRQKLGLLIVICLLLGGYSSFLLCRCIF